MKYTLQELAYMKGVPVPVREALLALGTYAIEQAAHPKAEQEPKREPLTDAMWGVLDAVEKELNRRAIPEVWLLMAHKAGRAYIEKQTAAPQQKDTP